MSIIPHRLPPGPSAATLDAWLRDRLGPLRGFDNPKLVPLGGDRTLWLLSDPYVDLSQRNNGPLDPSDYVHNTLMVQDGQCFSLVQRVAGGLPWEFAPSRSPGDWYWPLGGSIGDGGLLYVFWSRMIEDGAQAPLDGITRHPIQTYLGVYDPQTFGVDPVRAGAERRRRPAVRLGGADRADGWSYLFGNSNLLELSREGGWKPDGDVLRHAHVPRPRAAPGSSSARREYYTGSGWSSSAARRRARSRRAGRSPTRCSPG